MARKYTLRLRVIKIKSLRNRFRHWLGKPRVESIFEYTDATDGEYGIAVYQKCLAECNRRNYVPMGFDGINACDKG